MRSLGSIEIGLTEHLEGDAGEPTARILATARELVCLADSLGVRYAWFAEHHLHTHRGHLPTPLLFCVHLAAQTNNISLGTAVICLNQHRAVDVAEQVAVADVLSGERMAVGFGSGSTPVESALFDVPDMSEAERHAKFDQALSDIAAAWFGGATRSAPLPRPNDSLRGRCWCAVNSVGAAAIAGRHGLNALYSHLRTPAQYRDFERVYRAAGGRGLVAANRPLIVAETEQQADELGQIVIRRLWRRFQAEGKIAAAAREPNSLAAVSQHPLNFIVGGPASVAEQIAALHDASPFDVLNVELTWDGLNAADSQKSLRLLVEEVLPRLTRSSSVAAARDLVVDRKPAGALH